MTWRLEWSLRSFVFIKKTQVIQVDRKGVKVGKGEKRKGRGKGGMNEGRCQKTKNIFEILFYWFSNTIPESNSMKKFWIRPFINLSTVLNLVIKNYSQGCNSELFFPRIKSEWNKDELSIEACKVQFIHDHRQLRLKFGFLKNYKFIMVNYMIHNS